MTQEQIIGQNIRKERLKRNLTSVQFATMLKITPSYLGSIERGTRRISISKMFKLDEIFNIDLNGLLLEKDKNIEVSQIAIEPKAIMEYMINNFNLLERYFIVSLMTHYSKLKTDENMSKTDILEYLNEILK